MFSWVFKREIVFAVRSKQSFLCVNHILTQGRFKSESVVSKLPDNVPILKPIAKTSSSAALRIKTINKAMKAYLERARNYEDFLKVKNTEYEIGRQHLANMMGLDANNLMQDDIERAIEYLLPSGLYEKRARPMMKPPDTLYPKEKAAQFDANGRPFSPFFYTRKSNYNSTLHKLVAKFHELDQLEDRMIAQGILSPPKESLLFMGGGNWMPLEEVCNLFLENITETEHGFMVATLTRLAQHPYAFRCKDFLDKFWVKFSDLGSLEEIPELMKGEDGRPYMDAVGKRKWSVAKVTVRGKGTGKMSINGADISFFDRLQDREQILYPLQFSGLLGQVDVEADVQGQGGKALAGALRHGLSLALRSFIPLDDVEKMRLAGLLTHDNRFKGRKVPGQKGCRAKYTWKKR